jgi:hypothetical protein
MRRTIASPGLCELNTTSSTCLLDAKIPAALAPVYEAVKAILTLAPGDWRSCREVFGAAIAEDGATIAMRLHRPAEVRRQRWSPRSCWSPATTGLVFVFTP